MTHLPEDEVQAAVRDAILDYHREASVVGSGDVLVRGYRYADLQVKRDSRPDVLVEVENSVTASDYRDGISQALHYGRAGYVPVLALPLIEGDLADPDTNTGEVLNVAADARVGLMAVWFEEDADSEGHAVTGAGYVLRPFR